MRLTSLFIRRPRERRRAPASRASYRPGLEVLEDRTVLSVLPVTSLADGGAGTLRQAILDANSLPGDDTIDIQVTGTINLASVLPNLNTNLAIEGPGADQLTVRRHTGGAYRIFTVATGTTVSISGLTIANGLVAGGGGGPIFGGGIINAGTLMIGNCTLTGNGAQSDFGSGGAGGGSIYNAGVLTVINSTLFGNAAVALADLSRSGGGGIFSSGALTISSSTVSGNSALSYYPAEGGGILAAALTINHSTVTGNSATDLGGFAYEPGGIAAVALVARNTIIAGNSGDPATGSIDSNYNLWGGDPRLGPLQNNGGPTWTHALLPGSPALDVGDNAGAPEFDQRGLPRIGADTIDIGAFEVQVGPVAFYLYLDAGPVTAGVPFDLYVFALDAYGHVVTDYAGEVFFYSPDDTALLPEPYTFRP